MCLNDEDWYNELRERFKAVVGMKAQWERNYEDREQYSNPESKFYNPDAWSRLIGESNVVPTYLNGESVKTLLDTGAQISFISEKYAKRRGFKIHPIEKLVNFQGANGLGIDYEGYTEVNLQLPDKGFNQDILLLVVPHIEYHDFVPITLGTLTLGLIDDHFVETQQLETLEKEWRLVHQTILYRQSLAKDEVLGQVRATKSFKVPAHSCINVPGFVKVDKGGYSVHCVAEPSLKATLPEGISLAGEQYLDLKQGSSRVGILLQNETEKDITVRPRTTICQLVVGNLVPKLVAPSSDFTEMDRHLLEECLEQENLLEEENVENPPTDYEEQIDYSEFKKLAEQQTFTKPSGLKSAFVPTMSCTAGNPVEETSTNSNSTEDGSWLLDQIDISGASRYGEEFHQKAKELFLKYHTTFSRNDMDLGRATNVKHHIVLTDPIPFKERYRRIPPQLYDEVRAHLQDMLRLGAIRRSCSPWASAIVLVRKKNGKLRFCIDLRKLNSKTLKDSYALPRIEQTLESLAGSRIYSTLDLTSGYWQVEMAEECKPYTAFTVGPLGFYQCETMPFGATNASATFQRLMEDCLGDLNMNWCIVYLDDVIVYSQSPEEHLERLEAVFQKLSAYGLKLKPSKCTFFQEKITYLGHLITAEGVATDPTKVEVVKNWPELETVSDVRSFLGFVGYYRRFIKGFSQIAKPLYQLTRGLESQCKRTAKKTFIKWGEREEEAFRVLKEACTTAPVLAYPNYTLPFILHTDSSTDGLGAVLYQKQEEGTRVIAYASRSLTASEANYAPHKLEFLALKWAVTDKFKEYLYGGNWFEVYTDNNPLTYILSTAKLDACGQRWVAELANFNFTLHYKPGSTNTVADALSRIAWPDVLSQQDTEEYESMPANLVQTICHGACVEALMDLCSYTGSVVPMQPHIPASRGWSLDDWVQLQSQDPDLKVIINGLKDNTLRNRRIKNSDSSTLKHYLRMQPQLELCDDVLYRKSYTANHRSRGIRLQIILPKTLITRVMAGCHDQVGHQGRDRTVSLVRERFYWDTLYRDTSNYISNCSRCIRRKSKAQRAPLQPIFASQPMEIVYLDHLTLEPCKGNIESILVVTDHFTRYAQAYPVKNQTAKTTAKILWEQFLRHYGFPQKILTDQGPGFESDLFKELLDLATIEKVRTTSYHPQTNGQCERFNSTLMNMLGTLSPEQKRDWKAHLLTMCQAYNATQHPSTGFSPYFLMFGRHRRLPIDYQMGINRNDLCDTSKSKFVSDLQDRLQFAYDTADKLAQKEAERSKKLYDRRSRGVELLPQDLVLVKKVAWTGRHKIQDKWEEGEYVVLSRPDPYLPVYKVQPVEGGKIRTLHRNLLLPLGLQLKPDSEIESQSPTDFELEQQEGVFEQDSGKSPKETHLLDSGTSGSSETDIVDPLNAFTEFWELVEDNEVDGAKDSESAVSETDNQASTRVGQPNKQDEIERAGHSQSQIDHQPDPGSKSPSTKVPRRSSRFRKKPERLGFTLSPFTAKWI